FCSSMIGGSVQQLPGHVTGMRDLSVAKPSRSKLCHRTVPHASCSTAHREQQVKGAIGGPARAVPEDVKSEKPRKSRERKRSKRFKRQQPERKEKRRNGQRRANHEQHHELSKPSATHDVQHQRRYTFVFR